MRSKPPIVEIPHRPAYTPGSGPPMAAVTLIPDNTETGWIIDDVVEFQGIPQYVITPKDNPAHRKPVRKERILDWISAKAYEDFEYARYTRQTDEEWERDNMALKEAAEIKEKRFGEIQARRQARSEAQGAAVSSKLKDRLELRRNGCVSVSDSGNENSEPPITQRLSAKRRHPQEPLSGSAPVVKRRAVSGSSQGLTLQQKSPSSARAIYKSSTSDNVSDASVEDDEDAISEGTRRNHTAKENQPIRPPQKHFHGSLTGFTSGKAIISKPSPLQNIISRPSQMQNSNWYDLGPPILVSVVLPKSPIPTGLYGPTLVMDGILKERNRNQNDYPAILPPGRNANVQPSSLKSNTFHKSIHVRTSLAVSVAAESMDESQSLSGSENSPVAVNTPRSTCKKVLDTSKPSLSQTTTRGIGLLKRATTRRQREVANVEKGTRPRKNFREKKPHAPMRHKLDKGKGREVPGPESELLLRQNRELEIKLQNAAAGDSEEEDEEMWEIHGVLDDEVRTVNGRKMQYYLCSWVGDYEPTWEPEYNVSVHSINIYKQNLARDLGFDSASDIAGPSNSGTREQAEADHEANLARHREGIADALPFLQLAKDLEFDANVTGGLEGDYNLQLRTANKWAERYL